MNYLIGSSHLSYKRKSIYCVILNRCVKLFRIMKSLNNCVQEFIDHHSSTLFPSDNSIDTRRPRVNRFNSITSPSIDIEEEDPSLLFFLLFFY